MTEQLCGHEVSADQVASAVRAHGTQMDDQTILLARFTATDQPPL